MSRTRSLSKLILLAGAAASAVVTLIPRDASALPPVSTPMGSRGQFAIDQISGFRLAVGPNAGESALSYYGPIGVSISSQTERDVNSVVVSDNTAHFTTFFIAPSADYFVIDHLSLGALIEFSTTSVSIDNTQNGVTHTNPPLPSLTNVTLLPRVGWLFSLSDRFAIWPRLGIGYVSRQMLGSNGADTYSGALFDLDVGFLFRVTEGWFFRAAPELGLTPGSHSQTLMGAGSQSASASAYQFAISSGVGVFFSL